MFMADFHKIVYVCVSHAVLDVRKVFLVCYGIVSSALGCFGVFFEWFWGVSSEMYFTNWVKAAERDNFQI